MFAIEHCGVKPDIMTMAKGIANGLPLAVTIATPEIAAAFRSLTISTFGGNPLSCAAANATIDTLEQDDLLSNCETQGRRLRHGLEDLQKRHPRLIGEVRGMGLMQALELVVDEVQRDRTPNPAAMARLFEETKRRGLLIGKGGLSGNVVRIAPPLSVSSTEVDEAVRILGESFQALEAAAS
jgi:4-aminobutyrate aminotransferase-like enzyme